MKKIIHNRIKCLKCGDVIESNSVHDFKFCSCQACAVDGGHDYLRRLGHVEDWEDMSETKEVEDKPAKKIPENWWEDEDFIARQREEFEYYLQKSYEKY